MLLSGAGALGLCGVGVAAAAAHKGGGDLARLASQFLLVHAAGVAAIAAYTAAVRSVPAVACGVVLVLGVALFSGDFVLLAFGGGPPRGMAPIGGTLMLAGWFGLVIAPWLPWRRGPRP